VRAVAVHALIRARRIVGHPALLVIVCVTTALAATRGAWPLLQKTPFFLSFAAVLLATHRRGGTTGAVTLSLLIVGWLAFPPRTSVPGYPAIVVFAALGAAFVWLIERRRHLQLALVSKSTHLHLIIANLPIVLWTLDREGRFTMSEGRGLSALGLRPGEIVGRSIQDVYAEIPVIRDAAERALAGECVAFTARVAGRSFECWCTPLHTTGGSMAGAVGVATDVTANEAAHSAVRESEARYRSLVQHATHGIYRSTVDGRFLTVNPALARMLDYSSEQELLELPVACLYVDAAERQGLIDTHREAGPIEPVDVEWKRRNGDPITVRLSGTAIHGAEGNLEGYDMLVEDITARRRLETQLQQAQKMEAIGRLAGGVAHDFNNLLTAILGYGELLLLQLPETDPHRADVAEILSAGQRGAALTRQLLIYAHRHVLRPRVVDLNDLVTRTHRLLTRVLGEDIALAIRLSPVQLPVRVDVNQLEQVILNLAINARDAMPEGGDLRIETLRVEADPFDRAADGRSRARLVVADTGCGMIPEVQSRAFDPFFSTKPAGKGTGLGLSTAYGVVTESDGTIVLESAPGRGTTFRIELPMATSHIEALEEAVASPWPAHGVETILLVEDDAAVRVIAASILTRHGYIVLEARDASEAVRMAEDGTRIDLLLTDIVMPGRSGLELARELTDTHSGLRVLCMSGYHDRDPAAAPYPCVWSMIEKPFVPTALLQAVREVLDRSDTPVMKP
jgi:two-component system, cell cycle sensor histidine kinase and response regulator CckA